MCNSALQSATTGDVQRWWMSVFPVGASFLMSSSAILLAHYEKTGTASLRIIRNDNIPVMTMIIISLCNFWWLLSALLVIFLSLMGGLWMPVIPAVIYKDSDVVHLTIEFILLQYRLNISSKAFEILPFTCISQTDKLWKVSQIFWHFSFLLQTWEANTNQGFQNSGDRNAA